MLKKLLNFILYPFKKFLDWIASGLPPGDKDE
jgi:hypothetical protein